MRLDTSCWLPISIIYLIFFTSLTDIFVICGTAQKRLLNKLFKNHNVFERPVENDNQTVDVYLGMAVQQIVNIDEKMQNIVFSGWLDMSWKDYNLVWDPEEFDNISRIRIPVEKIWTPDILLYNSADSTFDSTSKVNAVIDSNGGVSYIPPGMFRSTCQFRIRDFPFDKQVCSLKFGSWTHDDLYINLTNKSNRGQNDSYIKNAEWLLEDILSYSESISYDCCPDRYPFVMFEIHIRRRTLYYEFNLIFPCVLISCLTLLGFSLPPDSGEKISLEVTVLLVIITFSQIISDSIPASSLSVSKIGLYFMSVMLISSMSILANIFVLIFHHRNVKINKYMSHWVEIFICEYLARLLGMRMPEKITTNNLFHATASIEVPTRLQSDKNYPTQDNSANVNKSNSSSSSYTNSEIGDQKSRKNKRKFKYRNKEDEIMRFIDSSSSSYYSVDNKLKLNQKAAASNLDDNNETMKHKSSFSIPSLYNNSNELLLFGSDFGSLKDGLGAILNELRYITHKLDKDHEYENKQLKCKFAAIVLDRLCMVIFSILIFLSTAIIFTSENFLKNSDPDIKY